MSDTTASSGDWFSDTVPPTPTAGSQDRRLTVLSDDDWFDETYGEGLHGEKPEPHPAGEVFEERTARLRGYVVPHDRDQLSPSPRTGWQRHRSAVAVTGAITFLLVGGTGLFLLVNTPESAPASLAESSPASAATAARPPAPAVAGTAAADVTWCAGQGDGQPVTADNSDPGVQAIWKFESAFYYARNGAAARAAGASDAVMASAARLQQGIDQLEPGVEFCVLADPTGPGAYNLTVVERGPGIDGRISRQRVTTADVDGQTMITGILPR